MQRKVLCGYDYTNNELVKLLLYLFVGGTAALLEWGLFYVLLRAMSSFLELSLTQLSLLATCGAYALSTIYHYFLGNILVFHSGQRFSRGKELSLVFLVSTLGLGMNLLLMYLFVGCWHWLPLISKIIASVLCVAWNYLMRRFFIFR